MNKRDENKLLNWQKERDLGKWLYALINSGLTTLTLYLLAGFFNVGHVIDIPILRFENSYPFVLPAFVILYIVFLISYSHMEAEYQQLLRLKEADSQRNEVEEASIE